jgi:hypothetical protein
MSKTASDVGDGWAVWNLMGGFGGEGLWNAVMAGCGAVSNMCILPLLVVGVDAAFVHFDQCDVLYVSIVYRI